MRLNGQDIAPDGVYSVVVNKFLAEGGDGFTALKNSTQMTGAGNDLEEEAVAEGVGIGMQEGAAGCIAVIEQMAPGEPGERRVIEAEASPEILVVVLGDVEQGRTLGRCRIHRRHGIRRQEGDVVHPRPGMG